MLLCQQVGQGALDLSGLEACCKASALPLFHHDSCLSNVERQGGNQRLATECRFPVAYYVPTALVFWADTNPTTCAS